jgi:hypothetical protein
MDVRRRGTRAVAEELEQREPDLAEFLLEEVTAVHRLAAAAGVRPRLERRLTRRAEAMGLVLVTALRHAQLRLWREQADGTPLARLDAELAGPGEPDAGEVQHPPVGPDDCQPEERSDTNDR